MNRGIRVLQTLALPLGYVTIYTVLYANSPKKSTPFLKNSKNFFRLPVSVISEAMWRKNGAPAGTQRSGSGGEAKEFPVRHSFPPKAGNGAVRGIPELERATRLELATSTLARWRSTR